VAKLDDTDDAAGAAVAFVLERLARLMRAEEHADGLNPAQWEGLRYLGRANRFSNSPGALTRYLGATKGTVSQTLMALERKGFIAKSSRPGEKRSVTLTLTTQGEGALKRDPWNRLAAFTEELRGKTKRRLAQGLQELLDGELQCGGHRRFGTCPACRFFREKGRHGGPDGPHLCMLFDAGISQVESKRICVAFEPA